MTRALPARVPVVVLAALTMVAAVALALVLPPSAAQAATTLCGPNESISVNNKQYVVMNNVWGASTPQCISVEGQAFDVTRAEHMNSLNGAPASYPAIYQGCHFGDCTNNSGLPIQVSNLKTATSSWSTVQGNGVFNTAYDIWFHQTSNVSGTPNGAELMIWLNSKGQIWPAGSRIATVTISGASWEVYTTRMSGWNYIAYRRVQHTTSVSGLDVAAFIRDATSRGSIQPSWYLSGVEAGFEIWQGGAGNKSSGFSFSATTGTPVTTTTSPVTTTTTTSPVTTTTSPVTTTTSTTPVTTTSSATGGSVGCTVTYKVSNSWTGGFTADVTIKNNGTTAVNGWTLNWTWPGSQTFVNVWNATATQSGQNVTARNASHNASIPAGGSQTFGFQANGSAATPSSFSLNGAVCAKA